MIRLTRVFRLHRRTIPRTVIATFLLAATTTLPACGGSDTRTVEPSTTTARPTASSQPSNANYDGLVETLTKMGISEAQARCVVEKLDEASNEMGDTTSPTDQTRIEKLLEECRITG